MPKSKAPLKQNRAIGTSRLTPKQAKFIEAYFETLDYTAAAKRAYNVAPHNAGKLGWEISNQKVVQERLQKIDEAVEAGVKPAYLIKKYKNKVDGYEDMIDMERDSHSLKALNGLANYMVRKNMQNNTTVNVGFNIQIP